MDSIRESRTKTDTWPCFQYDQAHHITQFKKRKPFCIQLNQKITEQSPNNMLIISHKPGFPKNIFIWVFAMLKLKGMP